MENKKEITVRLEVKELVFDIQNKTYLTGRSREADNTKGYEAASHIQVSDDDENSYQIRRSISNAFCNLKTELAEYLNDDATSTDNLVKSEIDSDTALVLKFMMPSNYNQAAEDNLGASLHQYIVCRAIADWYTITNKADTADYTALTDAALESARRAIYKRRRPSRPKITSSI